MRRTLLVLSVVGLAASAFGSAQSHAPAKQSQEALAELTLALVPPSPEELAQDAQDPAVMAKKDGKLVLEQLAARSVPLTDELTPNWTVYRGLRVGMKLKGDTLAVQVSAETTDQQVVMEAAKLGLRITNALRTGAGDYVLLTLADPIADIKTSAAWVSALASLPIVNFAAPVFVTPLNDAGICFPTKDLLVRVDTAVLGKGSVLATMAPVALDVREDFLGTITGGARLTLRGKNGFDAMRAANALADLAPMGVLFAEPDMHQTVFLQDTVPTDPEFDRQWFHLNTSQQFGWTSGVDMRSTPAWDLSRGSGIRVAVLDVGGQQGHPDINALTGRDFTNGLAGGAGNGSPTNACENHGTPCAAIISGIMNNGTGGVGMAPSAQTISLRFAAQANGSPCSNSFSSSSYSWTVNALAYAQGQLCRISSNSYTLGGGSAALDAQISASYTAGMLSFFSTGNGSAASIGYPSSSPDGVAIGAMQASGMIASFSNRGAGISMAGPGVEVRTSDRTGADGYTSGDMTWFSGTSAACPAVAGASATTLAAHPHLSSFGLKFFMQTFCTDYGAANYDTTFGYGLPDTFLSITGFSPDNDECSDARVFTGLNYSNTSNSFNATARSREPNESCGSSAGSSATVYWRYNSTAYGTITADTFGSNYDTVLSAFNGCGITLNLGSGPLYLSPTQYACSDDSGGTAQSTITFAANPGIGYTFKVARYGTSYPVGGDAHFNFTFTPAAPPNNARSAAFTLNPGSSQLGTTNYATNDVPSTGACGSSQASPDVWYTFTSPCAATYTVTTSNADFDTVLGVYRQGTLGGFPFIFNVGCNDDCNPPDRDSCFTFDAISGGVYYIRVAGFNNAAGVFTVSLSDATLDNDTCATALPLSTGATNFDNGCASDSSGLALTDCGGGNIFKDLWYSLTPDATSDVVIDTFGTGFDTVLAIYEGACPDATATPLICNDDFGTLQSQVSFAATGGQTYLLRVGAYATTTTAGAGVINTSVTPVVVPPGCLADLNLDGTVDGTDFIDFINSFGIGDASVDPVADIVDGGGTPPGDGTIDGSDFIAFINAFSAGC
jgi:subtilisin family serine protease